MSEKVEEGSKPPQQPETRKQKFLKEFRAIALILVLVLAFRSTFFEPYRIPSGSMIPTLMIGDFIVVNKYAYGIKLPFSGTTIKRLGIHSDPIYLFNESDPQRGEVVVFKFPKDPSINYIKRIVGVPGDTVEIKNKKIYINGSPIVAEEISGEEIMKDMDDKFKNYNLKFFSSVTGDRKHVIQTHEDSVYKVHYKETVVPKDHYFVVGDNRDFSYDSRFWGFVPKTHIKGRAIFIWFSIILPFISDNNFKFRYWRIGNRIN